MVQAGQVSTRKLYVGAGPNMAHPDIGEFSQAEFKVVFAQGLWRRALTPQIFGARFWRRLSSNIDLVRPFYSSISSERTS